LKSVSGWADLFILPGHRFQMVDGLITNFHMPRSTLLMMVSAFARRDTSPDSGRDLVMKAYQEAIEQCYRLFSLGDCMLIF
jgi:S-adenosylmethionine:tRNA ribosyltransferase-isomerase